MKHKWAKEIKAWADGEEIESRFLNDDRDWGEWDRNYGQCPNWDCPTSEHRIKPQPKEPQYLYVYGDEGGVNFSQYKTAMNCGLLYIGKIKLEVDDEE